MIKPPRNSYGYRELLVYKKAEELQLSLAEFVSRFPLSKTLSSLSDQMERSARSTKQNIIEGWKRNSTNEYYQFLGFAIASNAELEADCTDICIGVYDSKGLKRVDTRGLKGAKGGKWGNLESIPFYPLPPFLPLPLQLKLRAKELNYLLEKLQQSLADKMKKEKTLSAADIMRLQEKERETRRKEHAAYLKEKGWD